MAKRFGGEPPVVPGWQRDNGSCSRRGHTSLYRWWRNMVTRHSRDARCTRGQSAFLSTDRRGYQRASSRWTSRLAFRQGRYMSNRHTYSLSDLKSSLFEIRPGPNSAHLILQLIAMLLPLPTSIVRCDAEAARNQPGITAETLTRFRDVA